MKIEHKAFPFYEFAGTEREIGRQIGEEMRDQIRTVIPYWFDVLSTIFPDKLEDMIRFLIPQYVNEGKSSLVVAIGCTGGKHRSVSLARELFSRLEASKEYGFRMEHRDIGKDRLTKK